MPERPAHSPIPSPPSDQDGLICLRGEYYVSQTRYDFLTDEAALRGKEVLELFTEIVEDAIQRFVHEGLTRHAEALKITKALEQKPALRPKAEATSVAPAAKAPAAPAKKKPMKKAKPSAKAVAKPASPKVAKSKLKPKAKATSAAKATPKAASIPLVKPKLRIKLRYPKGRK